MFYDFSFVSSAVFTNFLFVLGFFFLSHVISNKYFLALLVPILPLLLANQFESIQGKFSSK